MGKKKWFKKEEEKEVPIISEADMDTPFIPDEPPPFDNKMAEKHNAENVHNNVNIRSYGFQR